ncbi:MAG: beta-mannosidase [Candidatus Sumerlaeota bacterium]|nr:beta-mannosidase [Candidatus Sumerlaeota bacterium]
MGRSMKTKGAKQQKAEKSRCALNAGKYAAVADGRDAYSQTPLTVECRAKLGSKGYRNILVSCEPRESSAHWEIYSDLGSGCFSAHLSWHDPFEIKSPVDITDDQWHDLAMRYDGGTVKLLVDGRMVCSQEVKPASNDMPRVPGPLAVAMEHAMMPAYDCDGWISHVKISGGLRTITQSSSLQWKTDKQTLGLWVFDQPDEDEDCADLSASHNPMLLLLKPAGSLDEIDIASYKAGPPPMASRPVNVKLLGGTGEKACAPASLSLAGEWEMAEDGDPCPRLISDWRDAIPAIVPGSVHGALRRAGLLPDHTIGAQDVAARMKSFKTWWFKKTFRRLPNSAGSWKLVFDGVAIRCTVWLNGYELGGHEGMFGGPEYDVSRVLKEENTLIVRIDPAPHEISHGWPNHFFTGLNVGWMRTVVFNNVYGWHYSNIPALGIWRDVRVETSPTIRIMHPFIAVRNAESGVMDLKVNLTGTSKNWSGRLVGIVEPDNFQGGAHHFYFHVKSVEESKTLRLRFTIPNPQLWWPNDIGEPNLYRLSLSFLPDGSGTADFKQTTFGIRTIEMAPSPGGPNPGRYNWTFVINGRPMFVKGNGWCTMDSYMDFSHDRYDRFLSIADSQHVQIIRAWGAGMPETDDFYDLCDRKGIMVMQEWPTAWNSHNFQPYEMLEETVRLNMLRLRNHPSLVIYTGGNESDKPFGEAIDMMGRYSIELDGTRPFHRGEPWGGSEHNYNCWWQKQHLDHNLKMMAPFYGEFGLASCPVYESVMRYLPDKEKDLWPAPPHGSFAYHTPVFNRMEDMARLLQYSGCFTNNSSIKDVVLGSQLAQAVGVRHTIERARTRWPQCTGALYYKMNDNWPAVSWSCADWYGAPKISHYFFQDAFAPLHACVLFDSVNNNGKALKLPVYLLDDADSLKGTHWSVNVRAYDGQLRHIKAEEYSGKGAINRVRQLGEFSLTPQQTGATPLFIVIEVIKESTLTSRTFYFVNYEAEKGSLFILPRTTLRLEVHEMQARVTNTGTLPAVAAAILRYGHLDTFLPDDNYFWLEPGESKSVRVNEPDGLVTEAWNA